MKNKYQRLTKEERKQVYKEFKGQKKEFTKKMERMILLCKIGIAYSIIAILYDIIITKNYIMGILDGLILLFCIGMLIKTNNTKVDFLNSFVLSKEKNTKKNHKN